MFEDYNEYNDDPSNYDDLGELNRNEAMDYLNEGDDAPWCDDEDEGDDYEYEYDDFVDDVMDYLDEDTESDYDYDAGE